MENTISVSESIRFGWETFKKRPWFLAGAVFGAALVSYVPQSIIDSIDPDGESFLFFILSISLSALAIAVEILLIRLALKAYDDIETMKYTDTLPARPFWKYFGGMIVIGLAILVGLVLLIVPGIIAALTFIFTSYLIVDKKLWPFEAMKESARITKGHRWQLLGLVLALLGLNILGFLVLIVGLLVTVPISMLAMVHAYRKLEHKASEVTPTPSAPAAA